MLLPKERRPCVLGAVGPLSHSVLDSSGNTLGRAVGREGSSGANGGGLDA